MMPSIVKLVLTVELSALTPVKVMDFTWAKEVLLLAEIDRK